jgi:hypothetical protein
MSIRLRDVHREADQAQELNALAERLHLELVGAASGPGGRIPDGDEAGRVRVLTRPNPFPLCACREQEG